MSPIEAKRAKVRELLTCPVDWLQICTRLGVINLLEEYWGEFVQAYEVDHEGGYVRDDLFDNGLDLETEEAEEYLDWQIRNIETWIDRAKRDYIEQTRRFAQLRMADRKTYGKHFSLPGLTTARVQQQSSSGISKFYSEITTEELMDLMWESLPCRCPWECSENPLGCDGPWRRMLVVPQLRIIVQAEKQIGGSYGKPTEFVCFDLDCNTPLVHAWPVSQTEIGGQEVLAPHTYPKTWKDLYVG
jgi:hypothetical protein